MRTDTFSRRQAGDATIGVPVFESWTAPAYRSACRHAIRGMLAAILTSGAAGQPILGQTAGVAPPASTATAARSPEAHAPVTRRLVDKHWVGLWHTAGGDSGDLFGVPREIIGTPDGVVVLDVGTLQLTAFGRDGSRRWTAGRRGSGPGEFIRPVDLALMPTGEIAVLDPGNARVSIFGPDGAYSRAVTSAGALMARSLCVTSDARFHFLASKSEFFIVSSDAAGRVQHSYPFPWPLPKDATSFLQTASFARGAAVSDCLLSTTFGFGNARLHGKELRTSPFIEAVRAPLIKQERVRGVGVRQTLADGDNAALASFRSGDTLFVNFAGTSKEQYHVLDLYEPSGRYLESWTLPVAGHLAYRNGFLYAIVNAQETPELAALVPAADTARLLRQWPPRTKRVRRQQPQPGS